MTSELKVGVFFLAVLVLIIVFTVFVTPDLRKKGAYQVTFPRVQRLKAGDPVTYNGVRVGMVSSVDPVLREDGSPVVAVVFAVDVQRQPTVLVDGSSRYTIRQGILGGAELEILSTSGAPITPEAIKHSSGSEPVGVDEALASVHKLVEENRIEVKKAITALREGMESFGQMSAQVRDAVQENREQFKVTIKNIGDASGTINDTVQENREQVKLAIINVRTMAGQFGDLVSENRDQVRVMIETFSKTGTEVGAAALEIQGAVAENRPNFKKTIDNAGIISTQIAEGKGSIGKLVMDDSAYEKLEITLDSAQQRLEEVKPVTRGLTELKFFGGVETGVNFSSEVAVSSAYLRIEPRPWKFYEVGVVYRSANKDNPEPVNDDPDTVNVDFNLQFGWRWLKNDNQQIYKLGASAGLLQSRLGGTTWWNFDDRWSLTALVRQKHNTRSSDDRRYEAGTVLVQAFVGYKLWDGRVELGAGVYDLAYKPGPWVGIQGELLDNDLRNMFGAATLAR